jgi:hypothetical protein
MVLSLYRFPDNAFHISGFLGQDTGVLKLDVMIHVYAMHGHWPLLGKRDLLPLDLTVPETFLFRATHHSSCENKRKGKFVHVLN